MWKLNIDGTVKNYIGAKYENKIWKPVNLIMYGGYAIIHAFNGIFILDLETEELIWYYNFSKATNLDANPTLVGNMLFFIDRSIVDNDNPRSNNHNSKLVCLNLDKLEIIWDRNFQETYLGAHGGGISGLPTNGKDIVAVKNYRTETTYFINIKNGEIILKKEAITLHNLAQQNYIYSYTNFFSEFEGYYVYAFNSIVKRKKTI